jgi:hypothetical protein
MSFSSAFSSGSRRGFPAPAARSPPSAPAEAGFQTIFNAVDLFWITIRRQDDLLITFQQGIEGVEKLFGSFFIGKELNVIDQQGVNGAVVAFKLFDGVVLQRLPCPEQTLGVQPHFGVRLTRHNAVTHRVQQVSLPQTRPP